MSDPHKQLEIIKIDLLHSLARSQQALASMMEHLVEMSRTAGGITDKGISRQLASMSAYQQSLAKHFFALKFRKVIQGSPNPPWVNKKLGIKRSS